MGRPTKLNPDVQRRICQAISAGNYYEAAAAFGGVSYSKFREWMVKGEQASGGAYREFREAVQRAEADAEVRTVAQWQAQVPQDWRAARDFLARRFPERWGPKEQHQHTGPDGGPVQVEVRDARERLRARITELHTRRLPPPDDGDGEQEPEEQAG